MSVDSVGREGLLEGDTLMLKLLEWPSRRDVQTREMTGAQALRQRDTRPAVELTEAVRLGWVEGGTGGGPRVTSLRMRTWWGW